MSLTTFWARYGDSARQGLETGSNAEDSRWHVAWGPRALKIAKAAGVPVSEPEKVQATTA
ncbi:MAG: hypothetical protein C5B48_05095 [Candidatus Rokuibacteriota bacterium]|nr:MAG: hypothetical protein C5B48_05095 [Candidatus Rokubacteria bacterium]